MNYVVYWRGHEIGTIQDIEFENFHLSGDWRPQAGPELSAFLREFEVAEPEVEVELGVEPRMRARVYDAPDEFFTANVITPSAK